MRHAARSFLGSGIADAAATSTGAALAALLEPEYVTALRQTLAARGIAFLDLGYDISRSTTPDGLIFRRVYRVRSFVWDDALWVTRITFAERHFAEWPDALQAIWRETTIDTPDVPAGKQ